MTARWPRWALAAAGLVIALGGCGSSTAPSAAGTDSTAAVSGDVNIFAAASLTTAFNDLAAAFQAKHPGTKVKFNFAGSQALATQIGQGAPADVFAAADQANMARITTDGGARNFAGNRLAIVVHGGNPRGIKGLADLARPGLVVVLCAMGVPCGTYAQQALAKAGVTVSPKSQEQDVKGVVTKVSLGEADAGIVYTTDLKVGVADVQGVDIPGAQNVVATYPIAVVKDAANPRAARAFVDFVLSPDGQAVLARRGFSPA